MIESIKRKQIENFNCYTWPNPAFPFRVYYIGDKCRIFIIENVSHNLKWLRKYREYIRDTDYFFIIQGCIYTNVFNTDEKLFDLLDLNVENFYYMCNSQEDLDNVNKRAFCGDLINHNCWLDENRMTHFPYEKLYDAIYIARLIPLKRHYLASKISKLAIVAGNDASNCKIPVEPPPHIYRNSKHLNVDEICRKINESRCGLVLSEKEGACFSSSEYLLCGVPVVSTKSMGGRDVWYNNYNSIICDDTEDAVKEAVERLVRQPRNPKKIRQMHIDQANEMRRKFISQLQTIFDRFEIRDVDAEKYFNRTFMHKMRNSHTPKMDEIFKG